MSIHWLHANYQNPVVDVVVDDDLIITQRNPDDDRNTYHDPGKYLPVTCKCEFPDCSLAEEEENSDSNDKQDDLLRMSAPSIQSRKKQSVKGLHICKLCGKDYINKSHLNSHLMAHGGVTVNCEQCGLKLPSQKAVENHMRLHTKGPILMPQM